MNVQIDRPLDGGHTHPLPRICAVVVTYFPDSGVIERLTAMAAECAHVVVVDNGSSPSDWQARLEPETELLPLGRNLGLATALNRGIDRATALGFRWVITFDQDSTPVAGMAAALWASRQAAAEPERVAVVGPRLREERVEHEDHRWVVRHPRFSWCFHRAPCVDRDLPGVAFVITSGSLLDLAILQKIGPMDYGLFIDYIDHDYCLRAKAAGYEIIVSAAAMLQHNLGAKQEFSVAGKVVRPTFHPARRLQYMFRNRQIILRRHAKNFPYWAWFDRVFVHYNLLRIVLFEDQRGAKLIAAWRGTRAGWRAERGEIGP